MASEASTLPLELGGISDDRREQLEVRRQREMARQQEQSESRTGNGNFRWSPIAMIPAHLCVLIFLVFLLEKLEGGLRWPWAAVLSPLWFTDAVFIIIKSKEVRRIWSTSVHMPSETYALFPPVGGIIDHLGVAAAKVTLAYRLEHKVDWSLLLLFTPMWVCVALAGALRCVTPPGPQVMGEQITMHRAGSFFAGFFHLVARGAQPMLIVLKIDGQLEAPWSSVFIPLWMFMGFIALGGSALCCCAPMVSRGVIPEIRPLLIRGMLLCSVGTFSLALCALLFLVFLTLELDGSENVPSGTILAPLIALYALILVFLPLLLLVTRHYVRTMRTAQEQFRQANDPSGVDGSSVFGGVGEGGESGNRFPGPEADGALPRGSAAATPTILMRESSTLFRRASASFCRRLGEADGSLINTDIIPFELTDWNRRVASRSRHSERGSGAAAPQRSSRSFHGLQDLLPQAAGMVSRGGQRFTAAVTGTSGRESRARYAMSTERQRAGAEKEGSPGQGERDEESSKDERHDRGLLQGDSGTHSVTDSYDLNSYGSYIDSDEENHEVGLSIDGDEDDEERDGVDLGVRIGGNLSSHPPLPTPSPEILLAFGSAHGAAAFSLHGRGGGGGGSGHGSNIGQRWSVGRDAATRHGSLHGVSGAGGMPRRVSWPSGMTAADVLSDGRGDSAMRGMEVGRAGAGLGASAGRGQSTCYICCERRADAVVMECGHGGMCFTCATHLANTPPSLCPVCRKTISEVLTFGGVVTVSSGGGLAGGVGEHKSPVDDRPSSGGSVTNVPASAAVAAPPSSSSATASTGAGGRIGSGTFRRFSGPDVVGASAAVAGGGAVQGGRRIQEGGVGEGRGGVQRSASPPGARDSTHRDLEAQGMSEEGGWLDPV